jgi:hypothetical protein
MYQFIAQRALSEETDEIGFEPNKILYGIIMKQRLTTFCNLILLCFKLNITKLPAWLLACII